MLDPKKLSRRQFLSALAAGGVVTASGLWMPGEKLISIPKRHPSWFSDIHFISGNPVGWVKTEMPPGKLYFRGELSDILSPRNSFWVPD